METSETYRGEIHRWAEWAFAKHEVMEEASGVYRCRAPGTLMHGFRVVLLPGATLVYGDIGELLLSRASGGAGVGWLAQAVRSRDYLLEKCSRRKEMFMPGDAAEYLEEHMESSGASGELLGLLEQLEGAHDDEEFDHRRWCGAFGASVQDGWEVISSFYDYVPEVHWCAEALAWFSDRLAQSDALQEPT